MRIFRAKLYISIILATLGATCCTEHPKRAPSGFTGVRGKKSIPDSAYNDVNTNAHPVGPPDANFLDKRAPSGFLGMRGKKPFPEPADEYPAELYKRAPSGFMGMRGKKEMELPTFAEGYFKRAPMGFMGMRGKKEFDSNDYFEQNDKRAPMGFMGMRGKKDFDDYANEIKRAHLSGFFGMRGKKQPGRSGFFGTRGKKYPYEFRGKFVGVRGKKMSNLNANSEYMSNNWDDEQDLANFAGELDLNQLMLLLTENEQNAWDKDTNSPPVIEQQHE